MQLDRTRIAIRERSQLDTLDLALFVLRDFARPLFVAMVFGVLPFAVLNDLLLRWMISSIQMDQSFGLSEGGYTFRFVWNMTLLIFIQAPVASIFATKFLGDAVFQDRPPLRRILADVYRLFPRILWCQFLLRGVVPALLLVLAIDKSEPFSPAEGWLVMLALVVAAVRSMRPFMNEIILLERNPLYAKSPTTMTIAKRSGFLHSPSGWELFTEWAVSALIGFLLFASLTGCMVFLHGAFSNQWQPSMALFRYGLPAAMWTVAAFMTVVRFLNYLDLRIRREGWEVELRMRAEAARLTGIHA